MALSNNAGVQRLTAEDGHEFDCWIQSATTTRKGGLVILQEIFGVTDQLKHVAEKYAALGYDVAIPALFDRKEPGAVPGFDEVERGLGLMQSLDQSQTMMDIASTVNALSAEGNKVAVMGFCWGGGLALGSAQNLNVIGAVAFYGTQLAKYMDTPLNVPMLFHFGAKDDHSPAEVIEQVKSTFPQAETYIYDAGHAFANDERPVYVPDAAELAHERTVGFLDKLFD